ncbi:hypothetical protein ACWCQZ_45370 [Streptomyces sp. NPDC002285]
MRPDESHAVLIGVAEYPDSGTFDSVEGASYNVLRLKDLLNNPAYAGFHRKHEYTRTMLNPHAAQGIRVAVKRAAESPVCRGERALPGAELYRRSAPRCDRTPGLGTGGPVHRALDRGRPLRAVMPLA